MCSNEDQSQPKKPSQAKSLVSVGPGLMEHLAEASTNPAWRKLRSQEIGAHSLESQNTYRKQGTKNDRKKLYSQIYNNVK